MANEITGITYIKRAKPIYDGDKTNNCALKPDDLDRNFFNLKSEDVKNVVLSGDTLLIDTWRQEGAFSIDLSKYGKDLEGYYTSGQTNDAIAKALEMYWTSAQTVSAMTLVFNAVNKSIENLSEKTNEEFLLHPAYDEIIKMVKDGTEFPEAFDESGSVITWSDTLGPFYNQCEINQMFDDFSGNTAVALDELHEIINTQFEEVNTEIENLSAGTLGEVSRLEDTIVKIVTSGATKEEIVDMVEKNIQPQIDAINSAITDDELIIAKSLCDLDDRILKKQDKLVSGENISTINGKNLLTGGDIWISTDSPFKTGYYRSAVLDGSGSVTKDMYAVAEGRMTTAGGYISHAEGELTTTLGRASHAEGISTIASCASEHAEGSCNVSNSVSKIYGSSGNTQHSIGIGPDPDNRKNAFEVMQNGDIYAYNLGGYDGTNATGNSKTLQTVIKESYTRIEELEQQVLDIQNEIADIKSKLVGLIEGTDKQIKITMENGRCKIGFADDAVFAADNNE